MSTKPNRISIDPDVMVGKPVIAGTRLTVEFILGLLANGWSVDDVLENYPHIEEDDVLACLKYARDLVAEVSARRRRATR